MCFFKKKKTKPVVNYNDYDLDMDYLLGRSKTDKVEMSELPITDSDEKLSPSEPGVSLPEEKIGEILTAIEEAERKRAETPTDTSVKHSISVSWSDFEEQAPTFQQKLLEKIKEKNMSNVDFYKAAWIDRKLFSAINSNVYYKPKKETAVACCLGLKLDLRESVDLLKAAGYAFSDSIKWDIVVKYCIIHHVYAIDQVNQVLYAAGEKCIGE